MENMLQKKKNKKKTNPCSVWMYGLNQLTILIKISDVVEEKFIRVKPM